MHGFAQRDGAQRHRTFTPRLLLAAFILLAAFGQAVAQQPTRAEADEMHAKIARVAARATAPRDAGVPPLRTTFTNREINAYFVHYGPEFLPPGIAEPRVTIGADGRITARAMADLDAVRLARERGFLDPLAYLRGSLEVVTVGRFEGEDGLGVIRFVSASVAGIEVPRTVAQELLRFYTRTPERPDGLAFDEPFPLPARLRTVSAANGMLTLVQ
jgi:hypothetical protein